jgi:hypothetical protein
MLSKPIHRRDAETAKKNAERKYENSMREKRNRGEEMRRKEYIEHSLFFFFSLRFPLRSLRLRGEWAYRHRICK